MEVNPKVELVTKFKEIYLKYLQSKENVYYEDECIVINSPERGVKGKVDDYFFFVEDEGKKGIKVKFQKVDIHGRIQLPSDTSIGCLKVFMHTHKSLEIFINKRGKIKELEIVDFKDNVVDLFTVEMPTKAARDMYGMDVNEEMKKSEPYIEEQYNKYVYGKIDSAIKEHKNKLKTVKSR